ncbi:MAG: hypothetical protein JWR44_2912 [Hymenobacter sp.]|jgi:hypothetical protein|nr:hypothetical protein [Hymenobacter sp.]
MTLLGLLWMLSSFAVQGQPLNPAYVPPYQRQSTGLPEPLPSATPEQSLRPGRYQTPDGLWHNARIGDWRHDRVVLHDEGNSFQQLLNSEALRRFVRENEADTVVTLHNVIRSGQHRMVPPVFGRQVLRGRGLALYTYSRLENRPLWEWLLFPREGQELVLRQGPTTVALPRNRRRLQGILLSALADDPASVAQLRARRPRLWRDVEPLLRAYTERRVATLTARP